MADSEKQPRVRTLETPMMPEHVHVPTIPPSRVGMAVPEARHYVHSTPTPEIEPSSRAPWFLLGMALMLVLAMAAIGLLVATNHVVFR